MRPSTSGALARVTEAMDFVEQAQGLLDRAAQKLGCIRHGVDLYEEALNLHANAKSLWYFLSQAEESRGQMSLDSEPEV